MQNNQYTFHFSGLWIMLQACFVGIRYIIVYYVAFIPLELKGDLQ